MDINTHLHYAHAHLQLPVKGHGQLISSFRELISVTVDALAQLINCNHIY